MPRERYLKIALAASPLLLFAVLEIFFRIFGLFEPVPLFFEKLERGRQVYQVNPDIASRYIDRQKMPLPTIYAETFLKQKPEDTFRIFCLGGSTTAGFPFDAQVPFPQQLLTLLRQRNAPDNFEIINLGISAMNSFTVVDLLPEVLSKEPDLILIYMGHNEFYGAYGSGSSISIGSSGGWIRFYLSLQKWRSFEMMRSLIKKLTPAPVRPDQDRTLMEVVAADKAIALGSQKYRQTLHNFRENLDIILKSCRDAGVKVLTANLVANLADNPPFASAPLPENPETQQRWKQANHHFEAARYDSALVLYDRISAAGSVSADLAYRSGKSRAALGDTLVALQQLQQARDLDLIRFRAGTGINTIIDSLSTLHGVAMVDLVSVFRAKSPAGLAGNFLFSDHLHPNPPGYFLMADGFYKALQPLLPASLQSNDTTAREMSMAITDLDWDIGQLRVFKLKHRWPFPEKKVDFRKYRPYSDAMAAQHAYQYLFQHNNWQKAHYDQADYFIKRRKYKAARREYFAILQMFPHLPGPYQQIAKSYQIEQKPAEAERYYLLALPRQAAPAMLYYQLARVQHDQGKIDAAIENMQRAIFEPGLDQKQKLNARFFLAGFQFDNGQVEASRATLKELLQLNPGFHQARAMLQKLEKDVPAAQ